MIQYPDSLQGLFLAFLKAQASVIGEYYAPSEDCPKLYRWACEFAKRYGFQPPTKEQCGIYYEEDPS